MEGIVIQPRRELFPTNLRADGPMPLSASEANWSSTPLGPRSGWSASLDIALGIILNSPFPACVWWGEELICLYNDACIPILGAHHPEAFGRPAAEIWADVWPIVGPTAQAVLEQGRAARNDGLLLTLARDQGQEEAYFSFAYSPIPSGNGRAAGLICTLTDKTQQVVSERRLRTLRTLPASFADMDSLGAACEAVTRVLAETGQLDLPFVLIYVADGPRARLLALAGVERSSAASLEVVPLSTDDAAWPFRQVAESGHPAEVAGLPQRLGSLPGGLWPHSPERALVVPIAAFTRRQPAGFLVAGLNPRLPLTPDYRAFVELLASRLSKVIAAARAHEDEQSSEERFRTLADNISQLAWMADASGWIFWYNQRWYDYTGTTLEQMQGWGWKQVHHPDHVERVVARVQHSWDTGEPWEDTFPLRGKDGRYRWFLSRALPIRNALGQIVRWFGTNTDVTEQRAAEEALRESDRRKDEFLATLAHELRNPLAPLCSGMEILRHGDADGLAHEQALGMMERQLGQLIRLVDDLLDVSRISRGKIELHHHRILLAEAVQSALEATRPLIETRNHRLRVDLPDEPICLEGDLVRLAQVFTNLLNNAAKYTDPGGLIELTAARADDRVRVAVNDDGVGMSPSMLSGMFELFAQDCSSGESSDGLGIGLHVVKRLVEMHGGTVEARSEGRGRGSELIVWLPTATVDPVPASAPKPSSMGGGAELARRHRILIADDNADVGASVAMVLRLLGNEVHTVQDGLAALEAAAALHPDIVVLDIGMPRLDGYQTSRRLRREPWGKDIVLVALSGRGQEEDQRRASEAGFDHFLLKPVTTAALKELLVRDD